MRGCRFKCSKPYTTFQYIPITVVIILVLRLFFMSGSLFPMPNGSVLPQRALRWKIMVKGQFSIYAYTIYIYHICTAVNKFRIGKILCF